MPVDREIVQQPSYPDRRVVESVETQLKQLPPLVNHAEVSRLKEMLAEVQHGKRFLLLGGDCAERFVDCKASTIEKKFKILLQMSLILIWGAKLPIVRIGRIAGQYNKPRSSGTEVVNGKEVLCFKGDGINDFNPEKREHDPQRLVQMYFHSVATLNYIRSLISGGFSDLHSSSHWDLGYVKNLQSRQKYEEMVSQIQNSLSFMDTVGMSSNPVVSSVDFFIAHEGLVLLYESALTRKVGTKYFNLGAHFLWIGDRTRQIDHAHVEYFRGIENPIGIKVGPTSDPNEIVKIVRLVNPNDEDGKVVLITRLSASSVDELLPPIVKCIQAAGVKVVWQCDPMHGNIRKTDDGVKTRNFDTMLHELIRSFEIHKELGSHLGGVHFELTGEDVTECTGGPEELREHNLSENYTTYCDPRLNYAQSMEMAFRMLPHLKTNGKHAQAKNFEDPTAGESEES